MTECTKNWIDVLSAFGPIIISIAVVYIAYQQWRTAERKRKQDLFDKRYNFFCYYWKEYSGRVTHPSRFPPLDEQDFLDVVHEAEFLFGNDIAKHIMNIPKKLEADANCLDYDWFAKPFRKYLELET